MPIARPIYRTAKQIFQMTRVALRLILRRRISDEQAHPAGAVENEPRRALAGAAICRKAERYGMLP